MAKASSIVKRWLRRLWALLLLAGLLAALALLRTPSEQLTDADGARIYVMDGDSLRIANWTVRLEGIDAVELHQLCSAGAGESSNAQWGCGLEARAALQALVEQGALACDSRSADKFDRALSHCSTAKSRDLAADLVAQGWAVSGDGRAPGRYLAEQEIAKAKGLGIWRGQFQRPAEWACDASSEGTLILPRSAMVRPMAP